MNLAAKAHVHLRHVQCRGQCRLLLPWTRQYFGSGRLEMRHTCRKCRKAAQAEWHQRKEGKDAQTRKVK